MTRTARHLKEIVLLAALVAVAQILPISGCSPTESEPRGAGKETRPEASAPEPRSPGVLPRLIDLGADKCIPCKMMAPILEELRGEYVGIFEVQFIDVWKNPTVGREYGIRVIPTQIFFDGSGKELDRHIGFISKEDILATWKKLGINPEKGVINEAH